MNICKCDKRLLCNKIKKKQYTHLFVRIWTFCVEMYMQMLEVLQLERFWKLLLFRNTTNENNRVINILLFMVNYKVELISSYLCVCFSLNWAIGETTILVRRSLVYVYRYCYTCQPPLNGCTHKSSRNIINN